MSGLRPDNPYQRSYSYKSRPCRRQAISVKVLILLNFLWWAVLGSNQWPLPCESSALPLS